MLKPSGMHVIFPHSREEAAELQSSGMISARGTAAAGWDRSQSHRPGCCSREEG